ncbi:FAD:protein FMN transferase [Pseudomonas sp. ODNR1LW]|nr:FAD:protein FMN transferase [Pseudomonas sp. ODNR1LW]
MSDNAFSRGSRAAPPTVVIGEPVPLADRADNRVLIPHMDGVPPRPPGDVVLSLDGETMGTTWSVRLIGPALLGPVEARAAIEQELAAVIAAFSPWEADSEISRFNRAEPGLWTASETFWTVLDAALDLGDETNGAVDPTLGALVDLWGFGPPGPRGALLPVPGDEEVEAALEVSGWRQLRLNREARGLIQPGGMKLDFSGIAKGYAVDRVSDRLTAIGATSHLVEIGGELKGRGVKPDAQPWWVEIERVEGSTEPRTVAALYEIAMATSGDYRRAFEHNGRRYPHTIDGSTGHPVSNALASVTVLHPSAMKADAYATALTVMGPFEGPEYAEAVGLAALFVERTPRGPVERMTPALAAMLEEAL